MESTTGQGSSQKSVNAPCKHTRRQSAQKAAVAALCPRCPVLAISATTFHLQAEIFNLVFPRPPNEARVSESK